MTRIPRIAYLIALAAMLSACSEKPEQAPRPDAAAIDAALAVDAAVPSPTVAITLTPSTITAGMSFQLDATFTDFVLVDPTASPAPAPRANEGHFHLYINEAPNYFALWQATTTIPSEPDEELGDHTFRVVLVNSAHAEIEPKAEASATLTIEAP